MQIHQLSELTTEQVNPRTQHIDELPTEQILALINNEDRLVADILQGMIPELAKAVDLIVASFKRGGRLFYIGAGSSGRIGILDASECPPTYGTPPEMVQGLIAGGFQAVKDAVEGAEDSEELGMADIDANRIGPDDVIVGIAASGRTPYVLGAMKRARAVGAGVIGLCNNAGTPMAPLSDILLEAVVGPEVVMGSTRMKAGTAQKLILNMLTTSSMIRMGKVYGNLMVDVLPSNVKLVHRAKRIIRLATEASDSQIEQAYQESGGHVKTAIVMILGEATAQEAQEALNATGGFVRKSLELLLKGSASEVKENG
ncbi:N-acetylmuramic acid 6-phosphate etherase [Paenibacillus sp. UNCCL117]|uniref:N-acetylmuramic acid 6-phosphate etherase n=1 Tax=unclassified Paenibacillus TaxID=185978 RepID=UPI0008800AC1|nr:MULTISPECIES: N-acetylmuramic acid 6-phosphate etherase [unclassified Paenibacillus]SDD39304.1 N-acetylmuramic acid 6-phosphate etherase [Paenibacillus sp. cl123]SFW48398.1 N-acetylmuramic acid 6-phosphate etherase [Paenibacillus sp. UNCCL117]